MKFTENALFHGKRNGCCRITLNPTYALCTILFYYVTWLCTQ